jgi:diguanylate cyclase (GGDEF)-like protein
MGLFNFLVSKLDRPFSRAHYFVGSIALLGTLLVGSSLVAWQANREQRHMALANIETVRVLRSAQAVKLATLDALRGQRGYLMSGDATYLEPYLEARRSISHNLAMLDQATKGQPGGYGDMAALRRATTTYQSQLGSAIVLTRSGHRDLALSRLRLSSTENSIGAINRRVDTIIESERVRLTGIADRVALVTTILLRFIYVLSFSGICLLAIAVFAAAALRRSFARERIYRDELQIRVQTDELTGVANRRQLLTVLEHRIIEARQNGTALTFAMFDLDHFKRVNDTHGHATGDRAIRHVVRTALRMVRVNDLIGRLGGEEFGIILPKADQDNAFRVCERLRMRLRDEGMPIDDARHLHITISSGIACLTDADDAASLIERADKALYASKHNGRDQVSLAA